MISVRTPWPQQIPTLYKKSSRKAHSVEKAKNVGEIRPNFFPYLRRVPSGPVCTRKKAYPLVASKHIYTNSCKTPKTLVIPLTYCT